MTIQKSTQSVGVSLSRPGMGLGQTNDKMYVYDIAHRTGLCIATVHVDDVSAVLVSTNHACPVECGAVVTSAAGGAISGFDMYGQLQNETLGAATAGKVAFAQVTAAPADALWTNVFGLPYKWASGGSGAGGTYAGPADPGDARGTFTPSSITAPTSVLLNYTVDQDDTFGNIMDRYASTAAVAETTMSGTVDTDGLVTITTTLIADDTPSQMYSFADGMNITIANGTAGVVHTMSPLWMSKYADVVDPQTIVYGGTNSSSIKVALTGSVGGASSGTVPPPAANAAGPYSAPKGLKFYVGINGPYAGMVGFDIDTEAAPDIWNTSQEVSDNSGLTTAQKAAISVKLVDNGYPPLP